MTAGVFFCLFEGGKAGIVDRACCRKTGGIAMGLGGAWFVGEACCEDDQVEVVRGIREACCDEEDQVEVVSGVRDACCDEVDQVEVVRGVRDACCDEEDQVDVVRGVREEGVVRGIICDEVEAVTVGTTSNNLGKADSLDGCNKDENCGAENVRTVVRVVRTVVRVVVAGAVIDVVSRVG